MIKTLNVTIAISLSLGMFWASSCGGVEQEIISDALSDETPHQVSLSVNFSVAGQVPLGAPEVCGTGRGARDVARDLPGGEPGALSAVVRSIADPGVGTDEGTAVGYVPRDVWVFQFAGVGDDSPMVGLARYIELSGVMDVQAVASASANTLVFVTNTHDANIEFGDVSTLGRFKRACRRISSESDCHADELYPVKDLIMSGQYQGPITTGGISVELLRNVVRLDLVLKNGAASGMTLHSVQLCNVPCDLYYASGIVSPGEIFPEILECFDYPAETVVGASAAGGVQSFSFYLPANQRGVVSSSTSNKTKNTYAPIHSSYFRVRAVDGQGQGYVYRIYPGANLVDDYNLLANRRYTIELSVNSPGDDSNDSRVDRFGRVDLVSSNSFLLNPPEPGMADRIFTIPIDKVNQFWSVADASLVIAPGDQWTVELIWQDTGESEFIRFVDPVTGAASTTFTGTGPDERFAVRIGPRGGGNALVGLRKVGRQEVGFLWSWHLWVTDYDPQYTLEPDYSQFVYPVKGGYVHRYGGGDVWVKPGGVYYKKYIMDRNLGARDPGYTSVGVLFYQFGRKDPMPINGYGNVLYNINGQALSSSDPNNATNRNVNALHGVTLATGVLNPTVFYYHSAQYGYGDWTSEGKLTNYAWNNPIIGLDRKSIYDPCPTGWKVSIYSIWTDFIYDPLNPLRSNVLDIRRDKRLAWNYNGENGVRYWPNGSEIAGDIYHPALGIRLGQSGSSSGLSGSSCAWSVTPYSANPTMISMNLNSNNTTVYIGHGDHRAHGFVVRCIQE